MLTYVHIIVMNFPKLLQSDEKFRVLARILFMAFLWTKCLASAIWRLANIGASEIIILLVAKNI